MSFDLQVPELAYLFGFLQADGSLSKGTKNKGRMCVELNIKDAEILEKFKSLVPVYSSIGFRQRDTNFKKGVESVLWRFYDQDLRGILNDFGLPYGNKSRIVAPPHPPFSEIDYFRGFLDGDGSIGITTKGFPFVSITTVSPSMASAFEDFLFRITGKHKTLGPNKRDNIYNLMVNKEDAQTVTRVLYYPGCLALVRKMASSEKVLQWVRPIIMRKVTWERRRWVPKEDEFLLGHTLQESARVLGRTEKSVQVRLCRLKMGAISCPTSMQPNV